MSESHESPQRREAEQKKIEARKEALKKNQITRSLSSIFTILNDQRKIKKDCNLSDLTKEEWDSFSEKLIEVIERLQSVLRVYFSEKEQLLATDCKEVLLLLRQGSRDDGLEEKCDKLIDKIYVFLTDKGITPGGIQRARKK